MLYSRLSELSSGSQAAFGTTFRITVGYPKAAKSFLKRFTKGIFRISKWFHRSKQMLYFLIFFTKRQSKIVKAITVHTKSNN
jgi:hypothetical protein